MTIRLEVAPGEYYPKLRRKSLPDSSTRLNVALRRACIAEKLDQTSTMTAHHHSLCKFPQRASPALSPIYKLRECSDPMGKTEVSTGAFDVTSNWNANWSGFLVFVGSN
ncbi:hypothetical protein PRIPAC_74338 [Pristionchus pacificus]|uniref:Uncharacterized protein n=1 Tax=Pristionchus pacificus TaxID=54126 RepID=A0A2A6C8T4_PRIPA|nr:hypothetical protein PRIPAC_74338 [Pristionchus pacificus]|eukprot:PDM74516.1 hypothetical protein PRIPAC_41872 [Pristionchus pacificus]